MNEYSTNVFLILFMPILAFVIDTVIGDPRTSLHPVVMIGTFISCLEKLLWREKQQDVVRLLCGGILVVVVLLTAYWLSYGIMFLLHGFNYWAELLVGAVILKSTISPRSLSDAGTEIRNYLLVDDLSKARFKVGWIVGRDTDKLTTAEVTRATVETISENIVDGIISPLFYFFIGGVPLAVLYRAVNTMDSMIGYKNDRYFYFGRIAARLDDVFNYIPARLTAALLLIVAFLYRLDYRNAYKMIFRDAPKHPSPNSGFTEAGVAGALGIQLGGLNYYFGKPSMRAHMGESLVALNPNHITEAIYIMYGVTVVFLIVVIGCLGIIGEVL